jgi:hypothetical protein
MSTSAGSGADRAASTSATALASAIALRNPFIFQLPATSGRGRTLSPAIP